jgi:four helix bundle protein
MPSREDAFRLRAFNFACDIVRLFQRLERRLPGTIARQILRSGTSIGANLEEAKAAQSRSDLRSKFSIALKEARETSYWLRLVVASALVQPEDVKNETQEAHEFVAMLTASVRSLRNGSRDRVARSPKT